MLDYEPIGFLIVLGVVTAIIRVVSLRLPRHLARLLWMAFLLRVAGSLARYWVLNVAYGGVGDATEYFQVGLHYSEAIWAFDLEALDDGQRRFWSTSFVRLISGFVLALIGPSMAAEFLVFSMTGLAGVWLLASAAREASSAQDEVGPEAVPLYGGVLACAPSMWFWPSSVGKDALLLLGVGLVASGYVGRASRPRWSRLGLGLALTGVIRPHVAAIVGVALAVAEALPTPGSPIWTAKRSIQLTILVGGAVTMIFITGQSFAFDPTDVGSVESFLTRASSRTMSGGSRLEATSGLTALPMAFVNVLLRPFLWEAGSMTGALAALETAALWLLIVRRRREVRVTLSTWRANRMLRFAVPCGLLLALAFGLTFFNMGILARQRVAAVGLLLCVLGGTGGPPPVQVEAPRVVPRVRWRTVA